MAVGGSLDDAGEGLLLHPYFDADGLVGPLVDAVAVGGRVDHARRVVPVAGAAQVVYATLMAQNGFIAPTINCPEPDAMCAKLDNVQAPRMARLEHVLCNSAGFGGTNASLLLGF